MSERGTRHRTLSEGLTCEPLLAVPVTFALLAGASFAMAAFGTSRDWWLAACTLFIVGQVVFTAVYDSPRRHADRLRHGCPHIAPRAGTATSRSRAPQGS